MSHGASMIGRRVVKTLAVWLMVALISGELSAGQVTHPAPGVSDKLADMSLTVHEGLLSLHAQNALLKAIVEAIGQQLHFDVEARVPTDERITVAFDQLSLAEALKRFRPYISYLLVEDAAKAPGTIQKLIVVSKRLAGTPAPPIPPGDETSPVPVQSQSEGPPERPKPFRFEFDPTASEGHSP